MEGRWDHFQVKARTFLCRAERRRLVGTLELANVEDPRLPEHEEGLPLLPQLKEPCRKKSGGKTHSEIGSATG